MIKIKFTECTLIKDHQWFPMSKKPDEKCFVFMENKNGKIFFGTFEPDNPISKWVFDDDPFENDIIQKFVKWRKMTKEELMKVLEEIDGKTKDLVNE